MFGGFDPAWARVVNDGGDVVVLDVEATGPDAAHPVWGVGAVCVSLATGRILSTFHRTIAVPSDAPISYCSRGIVEAVLIGACPAKVWAALSEWVGDRMVTSYDVALNASRVPLKLSWGPCVKERASYIIAASGAGWRSSGGRFWRSYSLGRAAVSLGCVYEEGQEAHSALPAAVQATMVLLRLEQYTRPKRRRKDCKTPYALSVGRLPPMIGDWAEDSFLAPVRWKDTLYPTLEHASAVIAGRYTPKAARSEHDLPDSDIPRPSAEVYSQLRSSKAELTHDVGVLSYMGGA